MNLNEIAKYPTAKFTALIGIDELLQINANTVSIISCRTGFCNSFYFLSSAPNGFYYNRLIPNKIVVTFPARAGKGEALQVLETHTGKVLRNLTLHQPNYTFLHVAVGTYVFFTISSAPNAIYFVPFTGGTASQLDVTGKVLAIIPHPEEPTFLVARDKVLMTVQCRDLKYTEKPSRDFTFMKYVGNYLATGIASGEISLISEGNQPRIFETPHGTSPVDICEVVAASSDGLIFACDNQKVVANCFNVQSVWNQGTTVAVVSSTETKIYEMARMPVHSSYDLQAPMPFHADSSSVDAKVFFGTPNGVFAYNIGAGDISKFSKLPEGAHILKIVSTFAAVSVVYSIGETTKIMTFITGTKQREEPGIDACIDSGGLTWVLEKENLITFGRRLLSIEERGRISLPPYHSFDKVFALRDTVVLYCSATGKSGLIQNSNIIDFQLPPGIIHFKWPAFATSDKLYILKDDTEEVTSLKLESFVVLDVSVGSMVWMAYTLFAVVGRSVYAVGNRGTMRVVESLPNSMCSIAAVLPHQVIYLTTQPELRVLSVAKPAIIDAMADCEPYPSVISRMLQFLPTQPIDPKALRGAHPLVAMSAFARASPSGIDSTVVEAYSRFARFDELLEIAEKVHASVQVYNDIGNAMRTFGQFEKARLAYMKANNNIALFEMFVILRSVHNIQVLASKTNMAPCAAMLGFEPINGDYEPLINLPLPETEDPIKPATDFELFFGDVTDGEPIYACMFDEMTNFFRKSVALTGNEAEAAQETVNMLEEKPKADEKPPEGAEAEAADVKDVPETAAQSAVVDELALDNYFKDDKEDEPKKLEIKIDMSAPKRPAAKKPPVKFGLQIAGVPGSTPGELAPKPTRRRSGTTRVRRKEDLDFDFDLPGGSRRANIAAPAPPTNFGPPDFQPGAPTGAPMPPAEDKPAEEGPIDIFGPTTDESSSPSAGSDLPFQSSMFLD